MSYFNFWFYRYLVIILFLNFWWAQARNWDPSGLPFFWPKLGSFFSLSRPQGPTIRSVPSGQAQGRMKPAPADLVRFLRTSRPNGLSPSTGGLFSLVSLVAWPTPSLVSNHIIEKPIATSIIGQWQKGRLLGRGTYGSVYEATNRYASIVKQFLQWFLDFFLPAVTFLYFYYYLLTERLELCVQWRKLISSLKTLNLLNV